MKIKLCFLSCFILLASCSHDSTKQSTNILKDFIDKDIIKRSEIVEIKQDSKMIYSLQDDHHLYFFVFNDHKLLFANKIIKDALEINPIYWEYSENNAKKLYLISGGFKNDEVTSLDINKNTYFPNIIHLKDYTIFFEFFDKRIDLPINITFK
ncbi:hypothetical protein [Heyndrickxia oleronia]|uniref:Lipoprotein n=1 Tax=Heyndrickxia oleronia TaxID=38875 RepID=A0AAW6STZ3_9BACI|nr:hypothetical protein [Heyndrickxia oleronia]MDH5162295.1 hypothetical protein [Heyndrickxia oleronia]